MLHRFVKVVINTWVYCAFGNVYLLQEGLAVAVPQVEGKTFTTRRKRFQIFYLKLIFLRKLQISGTKHAQVQDRGDGEGQEGDGWSRGGEEQEKGQKSFHVKIEEKK